MASLQWEINVSTLTRFQTYLTRIDSLFIYLFSFFIFSICETSLIESPDLFSDVRREDVSQWIKDITQGQF